MIHRSHSIELVVAAALLLSTSVGCYSTSNATDNTTGDPPNAGEPLEGPMYEPPGVTQNPARPQSERPEPVAAP